MTLILFTSQKSITKFEMGCVGSKRKHLDKTKGTVLSVLKNSLIDYLKTTGLFSSQIILSSQSLLSISRKKFFFYSTIWVIFFFHYEKVKYLFSSFEKKKYFFAEKFHLISFPFLQSWTFAIIRLLNRPYLNNRPYERSLWQGKNHP